MSDPPSDVEMPHQRSQVQRKRRPSASPPRERSQPRRPWKKQKTKNAAAAAFVAKMKQKQQEKRANRSKAKQLRKELHITKAERNEDAASTSVAFQTHLRMIGELHDQDDLPSSVTLEMRNSYKEQYESPARVRITVKTLANSRGPQVDAVSDRVQAMREMLEGKRFKPDTLKDARIVRRILDVDNFGMRIAFGTLASYGLTKWVPDIGPGCDPRSQYNAYFEAVAIEAFQQAARAGAFVAFGVNEAYIDKTSFLRAEYRSFVFSYLKKKVDSERRQPGSAKEKTARNTIYVRRQRLAQARTAILKAQGFPDHALALAKENTAHSDDELEQEEVVVDGIAKSSIYRIREKTGRSNKVTELFRMADRLRLAEASARGIRKAERTRKPQPAGTTEAKTSRLPRIPDRVPIDYFSPEYWNESMTVRQRVEFLGQRGGRARVALPKAEFCKTWADCSKWTSLGEEEFMRQYGDDVLKEYHLPTEEQIARIDELADAPDSDTDEEYEEWEGFGSGKDSDAEDSDEDEDEDADQVDAMALG